MSQIIESLEKKLGLPGLIKKLTEKFPPSDLNSLLLEIFRKTSQRITGAELLKKYENNRFVTPSKYDPVEFREFELLLLKLAKESGYSPMELSPLTPLGTCSAIATVDQNRILSSIRGTEVVADATNVLTLECSKRRKHLKFNETDIQLCTIHKHVRGQAFKKQGLATHFKIFCLTTAGRDKGNFETEKVSLLNQLILYKTYFKDHLKLDNFIIRLKALATNKENILFNNVCDFVESKLKNITFQRIESGIDHEQYYRHLQFKIILLHNDEEFEIGDGGFVDWSQQLTSNRKERLLISGIGIEFLYNLLK